MIDGILPRFATLFTSQSDIPIGTLLFVFGQADNYTVWPSGLCGNNNGKGCGTTLVRLHTDQLLLSPSLANCQDPVIKIRTTAITEANVKT